jgi:hypothetical protein
VRYPERLPSSIERNGGTGHVLDISSIFLDSERTPLMISAGERSL